MDPTLTSFEAYLKFLAEAPGDGTPVVLETEHALSLHFDVHATQSMMSVREPDKLVLGYTRTMMGFLLLRPSPARISMIGLGGGSLAKYCYRHLPATRLVAIEIDPAVIALRDTFFIPPDDDRFEVVCADGADYVKGQDARPDVILVDGFVSSGMPARLGTADFYAACHRRLADDGVLVANYLESDEDIPFYLEEVSSVFGDSFVVSLSEDSCNYTLFAWKGEWALPSLDALLARARILEMAHPLNLRSAARRMKRGRQFAADSSFWRKLAN
ncbi:fused MFS/spermidine synthase [Cupriavidus basilensis]|uniref:Fused MFS/spermidine synthase n=1 Tax=Cupriavidus basilensis TaxID=68895 RepID=A0ABT6AYV4_9BURK|nr:fused MFS/spermidine synthase [Cupriavidus basilensis]MDF3837447.1 fused MFS/spermidine synthase [Cupriavidus basilensis]